MTIKVLSNEIMILYVEYAVRINSEQFDEMSLNDLLIMEKLSKQDEIICGQYL